MGDFKNPFDPDNFTTGFGWDGKTVTVTGSRFAVDKFAYGDGSPYIDPNTGEQGFSNVWEITGITEDSEAERSEKYSIGKAPIPTDDGESFARADGKPAIFNSRALAAKFSAKLKDAGFDLQKLVDGENGVKASNLVGAMIVFKSEPQLDKDGNPKQDKNGYDKVNYFPAEFLGFAEGAVGAKTGDADLSNRAYDLVTELLAAAEGTKLTRIQLIQGVTKALAGDEDQGAIVGLVVSDKFNSAAPWQGSGTTISL